MPASERRTARRINLTSPIPATLGTTRVTLMEISQRGALIEHSTPFVEGARLRLNFKWEQKEISRECRVVRSKISRSRDAAGFIYQSGLEFLRPDTAHR